LARWDQHYFGREGFPEALSALEVQRFFTPTPDEMRVVLQRRSTTNRIAFALQIGFLKMTGRSLNSAVSCSNRHQLGVRGRRPAVYDPDRRFFGGRRRCRSLMLLPPCAGSDLNWAGW
jgi:hypothetical protein